LSPTVDATKGDDLTVTTCRAITRGTWAAVIVAVLIALGARVPFMTEPGFPADVSQFAYWAYLTKAQGLPAVYQTNELSGRPVCNYPPGYVFVLRGLVAVYDLVAPPGDVFGPELIRSIYESERAPATRRAYAVLKGPGVLCDVWLAGLLAYIAGRCWRTRSAWAVGLAYALLPAAIHNAALWGQVDSILALLLVAALWCGVRQRIIGMVVLAFLAFLTKAQAAMLVPVFAYLLIHWAGRDARSWRRALIAMGVTVGVVVLPFLSMVRPMLAAYTQAASYYPFVHLNGFSGWFLLSPVAENHLDAPELAQWYRPDNVDWLLGLAPRTVGFVLLLSVWAIAIARLIRTGGTPTVVRAAVRVLSLAFFVLSTQMHERYLLPAAVLWLFAYEARWSWWLSWLALAACVTINQAWVWANPEDGVAGRVISDKLREFRLLDQPVGVWLAILLLGLLLGQKVQLLRAGRAQKETPSVEPTA